MVNVNIAELDAYENRVIREYLGSSNCVYFQCRVCLNRIADLTSCINRQIKRKFWEMYASALHNHYKLKLVEKKCFCECSVFLGELFEISDTHYIKILKKSVKLSY